METRQRDAFPDGNLSGQCPQKLLLFYDKLYAFLIIPPSLFTILHESSDGFLAINPWTRVYIQVQSHDGNSWTLVRRLRNHHQRHSVRLSTHDVSVIRSFVQLPGLVLPTPGEVCPTQKTLQKTRGAGEVPRPGVGLIPRLDSVPFLCCLCIGSCEDTVTTAISCILGLAGRPQHAAKG